MKITAFALLAISAVSSAIVIPDNTMPSEDAVVARQPSSGSARTTNLVDALTQRDIEARHHRGKGKAAGGLGGLGALGALGGFGQNKRREEELTQAEDDAHWADLHTGDLVARHHRGKGKAAGGLGGLGALGAFGGFGQNKRREGNLVARHHRGKGTGAGGAGGLGALGALGGFGGFGQNKRRDEELTQAEDDAHWADLHTDDLVARQHRGRSNKAKNN
ncbi:hypothetical protein NX059_002925 [Plenodomus lindquistii]|nr:hypothetical protein NX059_002925 [Plenodomus lindquistii]